MKITDLSRNEIVVWGEVHNNSDEVDRIRKEVVEFNPDVILHELYWDDEKFYNEKIYVDVLPLEDKVKKGDSFEKREQSMIGNIEKAMNDYEKIAIVVGDTHLRTLAVEELGGASELTRFIFHHGGTIKRSNNKEIV